MDIWTLFYVIYCKFVLSHFKIHVSLLSTKTMHIKLYPKYCSISMMFNDIRKTDDFLKFCKHSYKSMATIFWALTFKFLFLGQCKKLSKICFMQMLSICFRLLQSSFHLLTLVPYVTLNFAYSLNIIYFIVTFVDQCMLLLIFWKEL